MTQQNENPSSPTQEVSVANSLNARVPPEQFQPPVRPESSHRRTNTGDSVQEREPGDPQQVVEPLELDEWTGNEVLFCNGACISGPDWKSSFCTGGLVLIAGVTHIVFVARNLDDELGVNVFFAISTVLLVISLALLVRTTFSDPGIIPPNTEDDPEWVAGLLPRFKHVRVNGHEIPIKYNETAHFYQPPRAHHCSINNSCIRRFDHHCPWVGNTIGERNYRYFLSFVFIISLYLIWIIVTSSVNIKVARDSLDEEGRDDEVGDAIEEAPSSIVYIVLGFLGFLFSGGLCGFHIYLISTNQTTYENYVSRRDSLNPYDQGCVQNWKDLFCKRVGPSMVNFRATYYSSRERNQSPGNVTEVNRSEELTSVTIGEDRQPSSERINEGSLVDNPISSPTERAVNGQVSQIELRAQIEDNSSNPEEE